jgi:leucyl aminopeptidase (aminopeptidase T)
VHSVGPEGTDLQIRTQVGPLWSDGHPFAQRHFQTAAVHNVGPEGTDLQIRTQVGPLWSDGHPFAKRHFQTAAVHNVGLEGTDLQIRTQVGPLWSDIFLRNVMPYGKGAHGFSSVQQVRLNPRTRRW